MTKPFGFLTIYKKDPWQSKFDNEISKSFPTLSTKRLILRHLTYADAPTLLEYLSLEIVTQHYDLEKLSNQKEAEQLIYYWNQHYKSHTGIRWGVLLKKDLKLIGTCGFHNLCKEHRRGEIGYDLNPNFWQQGFMTEALQAVQNYAFRKLKLHRLEAFILTSNIASRALLIRSGMQSEGLFRDYFLNKGHYRDAEIFSILSTEWRKKK